MIKKIKSLVKFLLHLLKNQITYDFVRINLGDVPDDDIDKDVDHISRFRIDQKDEKFYLVLNR